MIKNDKVSHAIRGQLGMEQLGRKLKKCLRETEKLKDWPQVRETIMDYAKLTGQLVEKREVKSISDEESSAIRSLVRRALIPPGSIPTPLPSGAGVSETRSQSDTQTPPTEGN